MGMDLGWTSRGILGRFRVENLSFDGNLSLRSRAPLRPADHCDQPNRIKNLPHAQYLRQHLRLVYYGPLRPFQLLEVHILLLWADDAHQGNSLCGSEANFWIK